MKGISDIMSPNDPELVAKTLEGIAEQDKWNDVFSTKLIELLDNADQLKTETRERMRAVESITQNAFDSLQRAELGHSEATRCALEAKQVLEKSTCQLDRARNRAEEATRQMHAAEAHLELSDKNLRRASELEAIAERKRLSAARLFRTAARYSAVAVAVSWTATVWLAWFTFQPKLPLWAACAASVSVLLGAVLIPWLVKYEA